MNNVSVKVMFLNHKEGGKQNNYLNFQERGIDYLFGVGLTFL